MGNCNYCISAKAVAKSVEDKNQATKSVFQYDKDARKIVYIGEDNVNEDIHAAITLSASVSATNSESGSVDNHNDDSNHQDENLNENLNNVRSLLGEIAEYLDEDDSTFATGSIANASQFSGSINTAATPTAQKSHDNSIVSIQPRQAVSPLLFDTDDVVVIPTPYSEKKTKNYDELIMMSKEQEMVNSAKERFFGQQQQQPQTEMVYKNPVNGHEEDSLLTSEQDDDDEVEESKTQSSLKRHPFHFEETRNVSMFSKYEGDDDESNETSLMGIEHILSEDKSEVSSSAYFKRHHDMLITEEDHVPSDEDEVEEDNNDDNDVTVVEESFEDENKLQESQPNPNDTSVSFGSFMHVSYVDDEENRDPSSADVPELLSDTTGTTLNVEKDLIIFSPDLKEKVKEAVDEACASNEENEDDIYGDTILQKENDIEEEPVPMDEDQELHIQSEIHTMPKMVVEIPDENDQTITPEEVFSPIINAITAIDVGQNVPIVDSLSESQLKKSGVSDIVQDILNPPEPKAKGDDVTRPKVENEKIIDNQTLLQMIAVGEDVQEKECDLREDHKNLGNLDEDRPKSLTGNGEENCIELAVDDSEDTSDSTVEHHDVNDPTEGVLDNKDGKEEQVQVENEEVKEKEAISNDVVASIGVVPMQEIESDDVIVPDTVSDTEQLKQKAEVEAQEKTLLKPTDDYIDEISLNDNDMIDNLAEAIVSGNIDYQPREFNSTGPEDPMEEIHDLLNDCVVDEGNEEEAIVEQKITEEAITMKNIEDKFDQLQTMAQNSFKQLASPAPSDEAEASKRSPPTSFAKASPMRKKPSTKSSMSNVNKSKTPPRNHSRTSSYGAHNESKKRKPIRVATTHKEYHDDIPDDISEMSMRSTSKAFTPSRSSFAPTPTKSSLLRLAAHNPNWKSDDSSVHSHTSFRSARSSRSTRSSTLSVTPNSLPWDEKEIRRSRMTSPSGGSVCSINSNWSNPDFIKEGRKAAHERVVAARSAEKQKKVCTRKWNPTAHAKKKGCIRCLALASNKERERYYSQGRHPRISMTCGGCHKSCSRVDDFLNSHPDLEIDQNEHHAICRICFNAMHR